MGCGASKDCVPEQPRPNKSVHSTLDSCRNRLHVAIAEIACKNVAVASPPYEYTQLGSHEDDGIIEEHAEATTHHDHREDEDVLSDFNDELEYQENKPPPYQLLTVHQQTDTALHLHSALNQSKKDPLRELSISHDGKLVDHDNMVKDNQFDFPSVYALSPRKQNNHQSYGGLSPSLWPSMKIKGNYLSSPHYGRENSAPLSPVSERRALNNVSSVNGADALSPRGNPDESYDTLSPRRRSNETDEIGSVDHTAPNLKDLEEILKSEMNIMNIDEFIENVAADCEERKKLHDQSTLDHNLSTSPNTYMKELLEHFDKSTEPLHMPPITPRLDAWQSKLLETIDKDIDMLLNDEVEASSSLGEDDGDPELHGQLQTNNHHTRFESIEL